MKIANYSLTTAVILALSVAGGAAHATTQIFYATGGVQTYDVTSTGEYNILAYGGAGGGSYDSGPIAEGGEIGGDVYLTKGEKLTILVGAEADRIQYRDAGGGGASYVVLSPGTTLADLLLVAGGGGGAGSGGTNNNGGAGGESLGGSGQGGLSAGGGGGGGYYSAGHEIHYSTGGGGYDGMIASGGYGKPVSGLDGHGGYGGAGGGGGAYAGGGGGGGYTGGNGGTSGSGGTGGTSYIAATFTHVVDVPGANLFEGYVTLTPIPGVPEPSTWAMLILGFAGLGLAGRRRWLGAQSRANMAETGVQSR